MNKNITVIGLGGVGGYFGFKIAQKTSERKNYKVTFVARGETFETVRKNGLTLLSAEHSDHIAKPDRLVQEVEEAAPFDLILICVKEYDLENVCHKLKKIIDAKKNDPNYHVFNQLYVFNSMQFFDKKAIWNATNNIASLKKNLQDCEIGFQQKQDNLNIKNALSQGDKK